MKIVKSLKDLGLLIKGVTKTIENQTEEQRGRFLSMLLGTLDASLLGNMWTTDQSKQFLISPYFLTNFEIQKYYQNEPTF